MKRPRIVVTGSVGGADLTDDLDLAGVLRLLVDVDASVVVVSAQPEHTVRVHGVATVPADLPTLTATAIQGADLVLVTGGRLLDDGEGAACLTRHLAQVCLARGAGARVVPYGLEVGDVTSAVARRMCRTVLPLMTGGYLRDERSAQRFQDLGGPASSVAPDPMFSLQPPLVRSEERIVVCLRPVARERQEAFVSAAAAALEQVASTTGLPIRFVSLRAGQDEQVHRRIDDRMVGVTTEHAVADLVSVLPEFGQARLVVTMHQQGVVGALLGGRPVVGIDDEDLVAPALVDLPDRVGRSTPSTGEGLAALPGLVNELLGNDADVIDTREEIRGRLIRARSVIERTLYAV